MSKKQKQKTTKKQNPKLKLNFCGNYVLYTNDCVTDNS